MTDVAVATLIRDCMIVIMKLGGPILFAALIAGLLISLIQAVTQINEATLAFLPKLVAIGITLMALGSFMVKTLTHFSIQILDRIVVIGGT